MIDFVQLLRGLGMAVLCVFFYAYGIGNAVPIGAHYLLFIYIAIVLAGVILLLDFDCLRRYRQYYLWMGVFILFQACTMIYTSNLSKGHVWLENSIKILIKISAVAIICGDEDGFKRLFRVFAWLGGFEFATLLYTGKLYESWRLGTQLLGNANSFALITMIYSLGAAICYFEAERPLSKMIYVVLFVLDIYMNLLSGGRKFFLFQITFLFVSYAIRGGRVNLGNLIIGSVIVTAVVYTGYRLIMSVPVLYNHIGIRLIGMGTEQGAMGTDIQTELMRRGIELFRQSPLFGSGIASYVYYNGSLYGVFAYAHSNYVELLADYGIVGTALYYFQYGFCFSKLIRQGKGIGRTVCIPLIFSIAVIDIFALTYNQTAHIPLLIMFISGVAAQADDDATALSIQHKYIREYASADAQGRENR